MRIFNLCSYLRILLEPKRSVLVARNGLKPRCKKCSNAYDRKFYPNIRVKKLARDNAKYIKKGPKKSKYSIAEKKAILACRKFIHRLKANKNGKRTPELLGYNYKDLLNHLGRMPLKNESIDHKIPITWFIDFSDARTIHDLRNLQILTISENTKKLNSYSHPVNFEYFEIVKDKIKPKYINKITHYGN